MYSILPFEPRRSIPLVSAHLLGQVEFEVCLALQQRLVYETTGRDDGHATLLICEHPATITVGRHGSRGDIQSATAAGGDALGRRRGGQIADRPLDVRWVNRGGPAVVHGPGQLAVYPIVPLGWCGWTVGEYLDRLETGLHDALAEGGFAIQRQPGHRGLWGRTGQVATIGVAVKSWVSYFGAYVNVSPAMQHVRLVTSDPVRKSPASALVVEHGRPVRMAGVRELVVRNLCQALGAANVHHHSGHALLPRPSTSSPRSARVG